MYTGLLHNALYDCTHLHLFPFSCLELWLGYIGENIKTYGQDRHVDIQKVRIIQASLWGHSKQ